MMMADGLTNDDVKGRRDFRLTKIICTLGPASHSTEMIESITFNLSVHVLPIWNC